MGIQNPSSIPSPNSSTSTTTAATGLRHPSPPRPPTARSEPNSPYPTTFVQADTTSFKQVVQMLTGSTEPTRPSSAARNPIPPIKTGPRKDKSTSKLYERRNSLKSFKISPLGPGLVNIGRSGSPRPEMLSPSMLDFPSLVLSPVTPLIPDPFNREIADAEEKAIKEKGILFTPVAGEYSEGIGAPTSAPLSGFFTYTCRFIK